MPNYYRIVLGAGSQHLADGLEAGYVGVNYDVLEDLTGLLEAGEDAFRTGVRDIYLAAHPEKSRPAGALVAGTLWTMASGLADGDIILVSDGLGSTGKGGYHVARVAGPYRYIAGSVLPHQRAVIWTGQHVAREQMSEQLRNSTGSVVALINITGHAEELSRLQNDHREIGDSSTAEPDGETGSFLFEKHLEDFLVTNWGQTELALKYDIVRDEDGQVIGQQFPTDTGPMDVLAIAKDGSHYLVVELKRGRASDAVVGQIQRYMGYVKHVIANPDQGVRGAIIALDQDLRLQRALSVAPGIDFYRYQVQFSLNRL